MKNRTYLCVDLKSFYASVECVERGLDPMTTNLVVADESRTEKTICLAVSPSLKAHGISGRARLFEVVQRVKEVNAQRRRNAPSGQFTGSSWNDPELKNHPEMELDYIVAPPRMAHYIEWSTRIYSVYLKYLAPEDIAKVGAVLRRTESDELLSVPVSYRDGYLVIDFQNKTVLKEGAPIHLTPSEYQILRTLAKAPKRIFTREQLISYALGDDYDGYNRSVDTYIKSLRSKIEPDRHDPEFIVTVNGVGYQFQG